MASLFFGLGGTGEALGILGIGSVVSAIVFYFLAKRLPESRLWKKVSLAQSTTTEEGYVSTRDYSAYLHKRGYTETVLRPAGVVVIDGIRLDVVANGAFIPKDVLVEVTQIEGSRIVVHIVETKEEVNV